ncbi:hypothetical protein [Kribbella sp. NPDC000426]
MPFGEKNSDKPKGGKNEGGKATPSKDLPILTPARPPRRQAQGQGRG